MLSIEMLPAQHGDCLWIEYGDTSHPHRILVDCGLKSAYRAVAERLREDPGIVFERLVLTHIDADHIAGGIPLLDEFGPDRIRGVWFNGWKHLPAPPDALGALHGEIFSALIESRGFAWNADWNGGTVVIPAAGPLPKTALPGGLDLTLLSPTPERLAALRPAWNKEIEHLGLEPGSTEDALAALDARPRLQADALGEEKIDVDALAAAPFDPDDGEPNGSSIALLAEHDGKAVLLLGDSFSPVVEASLRRLLAERGQERLRLDAFKVSHHGGRGNTGPGLLELVACRDFLLSTSGAHFQHPHRETIARILTSQRRPRFHFNYRTSFNEVWDDRGLQSDWDYEAFYPARGAEGYRLRL